MNQSGDCFKIFPKYVSSIHETWLETGSAWKIKRAMLIGSCLQCDLILVKGLPRIKLPNYSVSWSPIFFSEALTARQTISILNVQIPTEKEKRRTQM